MTARGVIIRRVRLDLPGLAIAIADEPQRCSSTIGTIGAYIVGVATVLPAAGATLTSVYLGQIGGETAATHLWLAPEQLPRLDHRTLGQQPGDAHARSCMLDHAAELQHLLAQLTGAAVTIDVTTAALDRAASVWTLRGDGGY